MTGIPSQFTLLQQHLRETALRHRVASQNIANINTPGYKANELVSFGDAFAEAEASIRPKAGQPARLDGNNVDIDQEIGGMERNSMLHQVYTQILASKLRQMRSAISGR